MNFTCPTLLWLRKSRTNKLIGVLAWAIIFSLKDYLSSHHLLTDFWNGILTVILLLMAMVILASFCQIGGQTQDNSTQGNNNG